MANVKKRVTHIEDEGSDKGPRVRVTAQDADGKFEPKNNVVLFGQAATQMQKDGPGLFDVVLEKKGKFWNWVSFTKVGATNGNGVNGSGAGTIADSQVKVAEATVKASASSNRLLITGHALEAASRIYAAYITALGQDAVNLDVDAMANETNAIAVTLFKGAEAIIKGKAVVKTAPVQQEEQEFPDPVEA